MKIDEIFAMENENKSSIYLLLEGGFYKAYEKSAFRFFRKFNEFQVSSRYYQSVACNIVRLGFPKSSLSKILERAESLGYDPDTSNLKKIEIRKIEPIEGFSNWKNGCVDSARRYKNEKDSCQIDMDLTKPVERRVPANTSNMARLYKEAYDTAIAVALHTSTLHRNFRFGMGDSLRNDSISLAVRMHLVMAGKIPLDKEKTLFFIEGLRIRVRMMLDMKQFKMGVWKLLNEKFDSMQNLLGQNSVA